jgi:L-ascorbate metabolism protein UlaG (beta-lactamase superfamily)
MRKLLILLILIFITGCQPNETEKEFGGEENMLNLDGIKIEWLGHAGFRITAKEKIIYIDPYNLEKGEKKADIILITHDHYDHCSTDDVEKIRQESTVLFAAKGCDVVKPDAVMGPGQREEVHDIIIDAVPAYNPKKKFHPKEKGNVGYVLDIDGDRIYHAGDTDVIPEMEEIRARVALLPVGGTYTMDAAEAAEAAKMINCEIAIPMHYGTIIGDKSDAEEFAKLCNCEVKIL